MTVIGGFRRSRNYARHRKALGRYRSPYQMGGTMFSPPIIPFFPPRAKPWEAPWQIPYGRIKGARKRRRRVKR